MHGKCHHHGFHVTGNRLARNPESKMIAIGKQNQPRCQIGISEEAGSRKEQRNHKQTSAAQHFTTPVSYTGSRNSSANSAWMMAQNRRLKKELPAEMFYGSASCSFSRTP